MSGNTGAGYSGGNLFYRDQRYSPARGLSLWEDCPLLPALYDPDVGHHFFDDFYDQNTVSSTGRWTKVGTSANADLPGGVASITTASSDNGDSYLISIQDAFLFAAGKPLWIEARLKVAEANTNDSNWMFGLMDLAADTCILDDGGGPLASYDGAVFYKLEETMDIKFEVSNAGTQSTSTTIKSTYVTNTYYRLGFKFDPNDGTTGIITPYLDGTALTAHNILLSGLTDEMQIVFGIKASSSNAEVMYADWVRCFQIR